MQDINELITQVLDLRKTKSELKSVVDKIKKAQADEVAELRTELKQQNDKYNNVVDQLQDILKEKHGDLKNLPATKTDTGVVIKRKATKSIVDIDKLADVLIQDKNLLVALLSQNTPTLTSLSNTLPVTDSKNCINTSVNYTITVYAQESYNKFCKGKGILP